MNVGLLTHAYGAYGGRTVGACGAHTGYAGQLGEIGWDGYVLGRRVYSACLHRFIDPDPFSPFDMGGINRYAYCAGDPISRVDPSGHAWLSLPVFFLERAGEMRGVVRRSRGNLASTGVAPETMTPMIRHIEQGWSRIVSWAAGRARRIARGVTNITTRVRGRPGAEIRLSQHFGGTVRIHEGRGWKSVIGRKTQFTLDADDLPEWEYKPFWRVARNARGMPIHLPDAAVTPQDTIREVVSYLSRSRAKGVSIDGDNVVVIAGGHGKPSGVNWTSAGRWATPEGIELEQRYLEYLIGRGHVELRGILIEAIGEMTPERYAKLLRGDRAVFGGICYLAADAVTMKVLNYDVMDTFVLNP